MRFVTYLSPSTGLQAPGVVWDDEVRGGNGDSLIPVIANGRAAANAWARTALKRPVEVIPLAKAQLLAPILDAPSVRHFEGLPDALSAPTSSELPRFRLEDSSSVRGPEEDIALPETGASDFSVGVAAVIGLPGKDLSVSEATEHVAGYSLFVSWTVGAGKREPHGQRDRGSRRVASTMGPYLVTLDELECFREGSGFDREIYAAVNGHPRQPGNWAAMSVPIEQIVSYASSIYDLQSGDIIGSGAIGSNRPPIKTGGADSRRPLGTGDEVVVAVEGLGVSICTMTRSADPVRGLTGTFMATGEKVQTSRGTRVGWSGARSRDAERS